MLSKVSIGGAFCRAALGVVLIALLANCGPGKVDEETFSLYLNGKSYSELVSALRDYSSNNHYHASSETLTGATPKATAYHVMIEKDGVRILFQNALAEQCNEREGRRDVEYSQKIFDVNSFSTSYFQSRSNLSMQVNNLKKCSN